MNTINCITHGVIRHLYLEICLNSLQNYEKDFHETILSLGYIGNSISNALNYKCQH